METFQIKPPLFRIFIKFGVLIIQFFVEDIHFLLVYCFELIILVPYNAHVFIMRTILVTEFLTKVLGIVYVFFARIRNNVIGLFCDSSDSISHKLICLPDILIFFLVGPFLQFIDMFEFDVVFDDGLVVRILFMNLFLGHLVLIHESIVFCSFLLFKNGLFILHFLHYILVVNTLLINFCSHSIDLLSCRVNFVIGHVNGSQHIGLLWLPECQSRLNFLDSWLAQWCHCLLSTSNGLTFGAKVVLLNFFWALSLLIVNVLFDRV